MQNYTQKDLTEVKISQKVFFFWGGAFLNTLYVIIMSMSMKNVNIIYIRQQTRVKTVELHSCKASIKLRKWRLTISAS